ncbi:putative peptidase family M28 [Lyophyllum shimeji]|uniref:Peptide hydrolase n=1 Tax=Lyophyllum shimeji TaxID=47721 RepID=A0A9P3UM90_LYOSH|nr:putative peptidase family M28 [Lyophyllum shimeji]
MKLWPSLTPSALGTTTVVAIYVLVFAAVLVTDQLPGIPDADHQHGLKVRQAWKDLHVIAARPHPYNSRANDLVRDYLLSRLEPIAAAYPHMHLVDDRVSNASFSKHYFEGSNILVKIDGTEPNQPGAVLFSAHYDSVSTSMGATDDGMAIVTMLQLVAKLAEKRSKRTSIFNFNNGEEDGLYGAHAFLEHPWSNLTRTFLNLEGAAAGGRPILFRGTSTKPLSAFHHKYVPHPHGTVLAGDAFARGVIRSSTDYSVYSKGGRMEGLDFAFYKGRSHYHTRYDAIPFLRGGTRALWSMMEAVDGAGRALLDQGHGEPAGDVVYFDLFGRFMVMFSVAAMQTFNIVFLVVVPIVVLVLVAARRLAGTGVRHGGVLHRLWHGQRSQDLSWVRFWISFIVTVAAQIGLVLGYVALNKYVVYSSPYLVAVSALSLVYLTFAIDLPLSFLRHHPTSTNTLNLLLLQLVLFSYLILLATTTLLPIGGTYIFSALATCAFLGWVVGAVYDLVYERTLDVAEVEEEGNGDVEPTEATPLIQTQAQSPPTVTPRSQEWQALVWLIQLLLVVSIPVILLSHIGIILIGSVPQGIVDGGPVWFVYAAFCLVATLLVLPLSPFIHTYPKAPPLSLPPPFQDLNSPKTLRRVLAVVFGMSAAYTSGFLGVVTFTSSPASSPGFPFSIHAPMKVFFHQRVELIAPWGNGSDHRSDNAASGVRMHPTTYLTGIPYYLDQMIVPVLPSAIENGAECTKDDDRKGWIRCGWPSGDDMVPCPGKDIDDEESVRGDRHALVLSKNRWLRSSIRRYSPTSARIWLRGVNTRACRVYFDNAKVARWSVVGGNAGVQNEYHGVKTKKGKELKEVRLWSRTWNREFVVDVEFVEGPEKIEGYVACEWSEYESGTVGVRDSAGGSKIPAYEEVLRFFPRWATTTKRTDGLTEVWSAFEM